MFCLTLLLIATARLDSNGDGSISMSELDGDGDGSVSFAEVRAGINEVITSRVKDAIQADSDGDGVLSMEELLALLDTDGDGKVDVSELNGRIFAPLSCDIFGRKVKPLPLAFGLLFLLITSALLAFAALTSCAARSAAVARNDQGKANFDASLSKHQAALPFITRAAEEFFLVIDKNGDGQISKAEMIKAVKTPDVAKYLTMDRLEGGVKVHEGSAGGAAARDFIVMLFQEIDTDDDKRISKTEWISYYTQSPTSFTPEQTPVLMPVVATTALATAGIGCFVAVALNLAFGIGGGGSLLLFA